MSSKSAKKNAKRREREREKKITTLVEERKRKEGEEIQVQTNDPVAELKQQLADAKESGDKKLAAKLRQDLWVLQDAASGHNIELESDEIKESMQRLQHRTIPTSQQPTTSTGKNNDDSTTTTLSPTEKEIKKIKKKLDQIENLKKKKESGEVLEHCQLEKIEKEESFKQQILELEEILTSTRVVR